TRHGTGSRGARTPRDDSLGWRNVRRGCCSRHLGEGYCWESHMSKAKHATGRPRGYITKSKAGHYTATMRDGRGVLVNIQDKLPTLEAARAALRHNSIPSPLQDGIDGTNTQSVAGSS